MTYAELCRECPACRTICNCKICLRRPAEAKPPRYSEDMRRLLSAYALAPLSKAVAELLDAEDAAARRMGECNAALFVCSRCDSSSMSLQPSL